MKCLRKACAYQAKSERVYCSPDCARIDRPDTSSNTQSTQEDEFSTKDTGEISVPSSSDGSELEQSTSSEEMTRPSELESESVRSNTTKTSDARDTWPESERYTGSSLKSSEDPFENEEDRGADGLIRLTASLKPSETSNVATSHSMTLIDESASHLRDLMKSVAPSNSSDSEKIKSACEAARQMTSLLRLKLDILREFRR